MINKYFLDVFKNHYVDFKGRATRKQYWLYVLFTFIAFLILAAVVSFLGKTGNIIYTLCQLAILLPSLAILARRGRERYKQSDSSHNSRHSSEYRRLDSV